MKEKSKKKKSKKQITLKQYKELKGLVNSVLKRQNSILRTMKTLTSFKARALGDIDADSELVKKRDRDGHYETKKKKKKRSHIKLSLKEIKEFFHGRGYQIKDDGEKPIKVFTRKGKKVFVIQRNKSIWQKGEEI